MARKVKGGGDSFVGDVVAAGVGAYAAKNATSMGGLLWTLAKYALVIIGIMIAVYVVIGLVRVASGTETFIPIAPSKEGDKKVRTPAGNVIMY
jgi:hypothetical protein